MISTIARRGVVHDRIIELDEEVGLPDGQAVAVSVQPAETSPAIAIPGVEQWADRLIFDSAVSPTERIIKGTRLAAETLVAELEQGLSDGQILGAHRELTREDLVALRGGTIARHRAVASASFWYLATAPSARPKPAFGGVRTWGVLDPIAWRSR